MVAWANLSQGIASEISLTTAKESILWSDNEQQSFLQALSTEIVVPREILDSIPPLPLDTEAVLAYGSRARGDSVEESDLDLLVVSSAGGPNLKSGKVSVAVYTEEELRKSSGTLFGYHLRRDSLCIHDPDQKLQNIIENLGEVDTVRVFSRAKHLGKILMGGDSDIQQYLPGLYREARYLLRSCLYAKAISEGEPCFSVRILADRYGQPRFADLLSAQPKDTSSIDDYFFCRQHLSEVLGGIEHNDHGTLEALIVNEWYKDSDLISMGLMALGDIDNIGEYAEVKAVFL